MSAFWSFLLFMVLVWGTFAFLTRRILKEVSQQAAIHARSNASYYVECGILMCIGFWNSYEEVFSKLSPDVASTLTWWMWLSYFQKPLVAMLVVAVPYLRLMRKAQNPPES